MSGDTPRYNPPGLPSVEYRLRTWAESLERMIAELPRAQPADGPNRDTRPLARLRTRASDDPTIALLDAWACVMDVLCFYQERIANEGFLRTATERMSVLELARAIGYELDPGVAATTMLALSLLETEDAPTTVDIPVGLPIMSVPGPGEQPQTFEVDQKFTARREWNALGLRLRKPEWKGGRLYVAPGTRIEVGAGVLALAGRGSTQTRMFSVVTAVDHSHSARGWIELQIDDSSWPSSSFKPDTLVLLAQTARAFGHRAQDWNTMHRSVRADLIGESWPTTKDLGKQWPKFDDLDAKKQLWVEGELRHVSAGAWFVVCHGNVEQAAKLEHVDFGTGAGFGVTAPITKLYHDGQLQLGSDWRRAILVYVETARLTLVDPPLQQPPTQVLELSSAHAKITALEVGQPVFVTGKDTSGGRLVELARVSKYESGSYPKLYLKTALTKPFDPSTVQILANVVAASHGETIAEEVLGSGDAATPFQRFVLRKTPLTSVLATSASGSASTLEIRVDGVSWSRLGTFYGESAEREGYVERLADDGSVSVLFGDGVTGARLPTGVENVIARYRVGVGKPGMVGADSLTIAKVRPLGLDTVTNPLAAEGGQDPERLAQARTNAPSTVSTLDRLVSVSDFEDYARSYPGITKARAVELWDTEQRFVLVTVAGAGGKPVTPTGKLAEQLIDSMLALRDPTQEVRLGGFVQKEIEITIQVASDPRYIASKVQAAVATALRQAFAFARRSFGQSVSAAEVIEVAHRVPGVVAVDLDMLRFASTAGAGHRKKVSPAVVLLARDARMSGGVLCPAELLLLGASARAVVVEEMKS